MAAASYNQKESESEEEDEEADVDMGGMFGDDDDYGDEVPIPKKQGTLVGLSGFVHDFMEVLETKHHQAQEEEVKEESKPKQKVLEVSYSLSLDSRTILIFEHRQRVS